MLALIVVAALAQTPWEAQLRFSHEPARKSASPDGSIHVKGEKVRIEEATDSGPLVIVYDGAHVFLLRPAQKIYVELPKEEAAYATVPPSSLRGMKKVGADKISGKACSIWEARLSTPFGKVLQRVWVEDAAKDYVYLRALTRTGRGASLFDVVEPRRAPQPDSLFQVPKDYRKK
jgi:hypothetical protein